MRKVLAGLLAWWLIGATGFIYWWTDDYDLTPKVLPLVAGVGLIGPLAWVAGYAIHGDEVVILPKRAKGKP